MVFWNKLFGKFVFIYWRNLCVGIVLGVVGVKDLKVIMEKCFFFGIFFL